ncbi:uncharacterized protein LOC143021352 [Oratosquilla oratoria]|uniref:uncharacterized protein LOC143021352 n=1 Tax=Oratosquilla oratoria TaxID=337810 RepID=UPI003F75A919
MDLCPSGRVVRVADKTRRSLHSLRPLPEAQEAAGPSRTSAAAHLDIEVLRFLILSRAPPIWSSGDLARNLARVLVADTGDVARRKGSFFVLTKTYLALLSCVVL